ncbi:hemicentin-2 isoform X2 [Cricetulus griseus]|uniref:Hemicentin-2 isoform X2 n=1 Tax=Cricetulus griseus TaxID=10029 RepID=A0A9J7G9A0_CRIGR|nr:hemicentin-2 isoform X2 [Cricetulus griseus]
MTPGARLLPLLVAVSTVVAVVASEEPTTALSPATGGVTLAFVFDVTGSMWDDLMQVIDGASRILERSLSSRSRVITNYALVPFHDPDIGPVTLTADPVVFQRELRELYVQGGGDCPEMSVGAIKAAVEVANPGSFIYVFSDARAKDYHKKNELLQLLQLKQSQVVFVLTGDCGNRTHPGYLAYEEIASTSSGQVFQLDKQQVTEVLKWVESAIQASKVHLLSVDHEEEGEHTWRIPFDPSLKEVTISLSGPGPEIEVRDPLGRVLQTDEGLNVLLNIPDSAKVVAFKPERPGLWAIKVYSSGRHSVRISGISNINFRAGFSMQPSLDLNHTIEWPLQGVPISVVINSTGLQAPGHLDSVELSHSSGKSLLTLPTQLLSNGSTHQLWAGPPFHTPKERFYLKVKGQDHEGNPLLRVSGVSYSGVAPGVPLVSMAPRIHGYLQQPLLVSCSVYSTLPFRLQLQRDGARLGEERHFQGSGNSSWEIPRASKAEEGMYQCIAVSRAGKGQANAKIVITDPPPQLAPGPNVTVSPGETAILSCQVLGDDVPYNLTWVRDWRALPATAGRVTQLHDLSLEVSNVTTGDGGQYQCVASNVNGVTRASTWLLVREAPQVSINARSQRFSQGVEVRVSCSASGYPTPHISWSREGLTLPEDSRIHVDAQGTLIIQGVAPEDAGNYSCQAANEVGTDEETVTLYYTDPPSVSAVNAVVLTAVGEEAVLMCVASGVPLPRIIWYRGGLEVILAPEGSKSGTLRIPAAQERDGGLYTCRAVNELGDASAEIQLVVGHAPRLTETPQDVTVELGKSVFLTCRATGRPPPTVTWRRGDGQALEPGRGSRTGQRDSGVLVFERVAPEDQGLYVCEARNVFGKAQAEALLVVTGHAPPQIASSAFIIRVLEGQPVSLTCVILAGRPLPERRWLKAGRPLPPGGRHAIRADGSLHLDRALQEDAGRYSCVATNVAGSQHRDVELVVQVPPRIHPTATHHVTKEGVPASLPCTASGVPTPTITWTKETNILTTRGHYNVSRDGTLVIIQPSPQDAGAYVCTATNSVGFSSQEMWLSVNTKPRIKMNESQAMDAPLRVTVKAGQEVTLDCEAQGSPPPLVTWTKDTHPLLSVTNRYDLLPSGSLHLAHTQVGDNGHYECTASNPAGATSRHYTLRVQVPPQVQPGPRVLKVLAGEALDLNCVAEGNPEPQLRWFKDGMALRGEGPQGSVHFAAVQTSDAGLYRCEASSSAGTDTWNLELRVLEPPHWGADETKGLLERVAGENASLPCPAQGTPKPQVTWRRGPSSEPLSGRADVAVLDEGSLFLSSVSLADSGEYECQATNEVGSASRRAKLVVYVPPSIREEGRVTNVSGLAGQPLTLECDTNGFPAPEMVWLKDWQLIPEAGDYRLLDGARSLHFPRIQESDSGLYTCRAENQAGSAQRDFNLAVFIPPSLLGAGTAQEVLGLAGADVELECQTSGVPTPQVEWTKDGQPILPGNPHTLLQEDGQVLRIISSHLGDEGRYQCVAFSPAGQQAKDFQLSIHSPPTIWGSNETGEVTVLAGHTAQLLCEARGMPIPDIIWHKDGTLLTPSSEVVYSKGGRLLQLAKAQLSDAGLYTCQASNPAGITKKSTRLEVYVSPTIEGADGGPYLVQAVAGRPVALECVARGYPPPTISWQHEGLPLVDSNGTWLEAGGTLQLENPGEASGGLYSCVASSPAGEAVLQYSVEVQVPPQLLVAEGMGQVTAIVGQPLDLPCQASGSPVPTIQWLQNGRPAEELDGVQLASQGTILRIAQVELDHSGLFACQATNEAGTSGAEVEVSVHELPSVHIIGGENLTAPFLQPVTLQCVGTGVPTPSLRWWKDGVAMATSGGRLQIEKADLRDEGVYTCVATNLAGESKKDVTLRVLVPPNIEPGPVNKAVLENASVTLECLASGVPSPDVSWFKGHQPISAQRGVTVSADGRVLHIARAQLSDAGSYRCVATNVVGSTGLQYGLRVNVPPRITLPPSLLGPVLLGTPFRLTCNATGTPSPTLIWLKDGNPVSPEGTPGLKIFPGGQVLTVASAHTSDAGSYSCVAVNAVGEDRREIVLQVHMPPSILGEELNVSVVVNESVALECQSHAMPRPVLRWQKDGRPLEPHPGIRLSADKALLEVDRAQMWDAGHYTCEALNQAGRSEKHFNLNVWVPPAFPSKEPYTLTVSEGQTARLSCDCQGVPFPKISWRKDGQPLPGERDGLEQVLAVGRLLYLGQARSSQEGTYICECSNAAGTSSQEQQLEVLVPPQVTGPWEPLTTVSVVQGGNTTLDCNATGKPLPVVTWERNGQPVRMEPGLWLQNQNRSLHVEQAQPSQAGGYSCVAENIAGRAEKRFTLSVLVPPQLTGDLDSLTNVTATLHGSLTLLCEVSGVPPPTVQWFREGQPISPGEDTYLLAGGWMLKMTPAREQDRGLYSCLASNEAGEAQRKFSVEVLVPPRIENEDLEEVIKVPEGQTAQLVCNATGHPPPKITWFKDGQSLAVGDTYEMSPDGTFLWVSQANLSSAGHYSCIAANAVGEKTKHAQLNVLVVPTILGAPENANEEVTVTINNPISLICEALAFPSPNITWMKDGVPFKASKNIQLLPGTHGLQILNAQKEDAGQYTCMVTNELGEATKNYHVEVLIPPSISKDDPLGEISVKEVKTKVNSTLTLECECWAVPPPSISWYKDGRPVTPSQRLHVLGEGRLLQIQPTQVSDSGRYLCVATNVAGEDDQDFNVLIQVPPMFQKMGDVDSGFELLPHEEEAQGRVTEYREIVENNPAYLYCDTNAVPPPELTWYKEGQPLSAADGVSVLQGGRILQLSLVQAEDAGRYSCKASNEVGEDWLHYELLVLTPPVILGDTQELVEEVTVNASSAVSLQCPALGNPAPTLSWLQNGLPVSPSPRLQVLEEGQVLQVSTAEVADAASYMCVAENQAGSAEKLFTLRVQVPPQISGWHADKLTTTLNSSVSLTCEVHAHPSPEVTWYKDGQPLSLGQEVFFLPGTHTLRLARVQPADSGTYLCEALNAAGRDQKTVQLDVLVPPTFKRTPGSPQEAVVVRAGDKAVLSCETDSLPEPAVTWFKDQQPLALERRIQGLQGGQKLEIMDSQASDKGVYSCKVSNPAGEATQTFVLAIQMPPTFEKPETETVSQVAGRPLVLACDVSGTPAPTVTWLKDRMPVESSLVHGVVSRGGRLQLSRLQPAQAGIYTCVAENAQAEARKDFVVSVLVPPQIQNSGTAQEHNVLERQEIRLDCDAEGQPPPDIAWLKDGSPLDQHVGPHLRFYLDGSSLVLKGLKAADSGAYTCVAHNPAGEDARLHTVNVLVPPTIEQRAGDTGTLVSKTGELVTMMCPVRGSPPIHVSWLKDGLPLPLSQRTFLHSSGRTLRISQVQLADSGIFTCVAASPAGVAGRNFTVLVLVPPTLEPVEFQNDVMAVQGSEVVLPCEARGSPLPLVSWMKDGEPLLPQILEQGPGLKLEAVSIGDSGTYSCMAASEAGEARRSFRLTVMDPPHIEESGQTSELSLTPGAHLELLCEAQGIPPPNITWHKDGQALRRIENDSQAGRVLRVRNVQVDNAGLYTCLAESPAGEVEKSFRVRVQAPPNVVGPRGPRSVVGLAPGQLILECSVEAEPAPEIEWHRGGILLQADAHTQFPEQGRFLKLQALSTADAGDYSCTARNTAGSTSVAFHVEIHMAPTIQPGPNVVDIPVNRTALLPCQAHGVPTPLMSWRKDGIPLDPGSPRLEFLPEGSLRIDPVLEQDAGHYLCVASNSAGSDRQGLDLRVLEPPTIAPGPSNLTLTAHSPASLPCEAKGSPKPLVSWWKDGQKLDFRLQQDAYRLLPSNALLLAAPSPQDSAQFECVVSNEVGESRRRYQVTVHVPPTIADDQTDFTVTRMAPVVLTCHSTGSPAPAVSWSKAGTKLGARGSGYRVLPSGALEIEQALPIHAGRYTCTARNSAGMARKHMVLIVQASPVVKPLPSVVQAVESEEVLLPCEASGIPQPVVIWQKEGLSIPEGTRIRVLASGQLWITHTSPEDAGNYFCIAQNSVGSAMAKTRLVVQVPPVIENGLPDLSTTEGSNALLPCTAKGSPEPAITWEKDGQLVSGADGKFALQPSGELLVKSSESQDAGTYICTAENAVGRARRRVHLTILTLPVLTTLPGDRSLRLGDRLWLRCAARGSPTPRIGWTINDQPVTEGVSEQDGGSTLQRAAVAREDGGTYVCWAENRVGRVQAVSFVHVKEAPVLQGEAFSYLVEPVGGSIRLDCVVRGDPAPDIRWTKDSLPLPVSRLYLQLQNGSLTILRTKMDDAGRYQCLATNEMGAVKKVVTLVLQSAPVFLVEPRDLTVRLGEDVELRCQATGEPVPTIEWLRAGRPLQADRRLRTLPDGSLWLGHVEAGDAGAYECVAHNLLGSATAQALLAVRGEPRGSRGSMIGVINGQEFGMATLNTSVQQEGSSGVATIWSSISHVPASVGPLMRVLVVTIAPIYWALARESGGALNGYSLTGGSFQQESHMEFSTGELLTMTQMARGLDPDGLLLLEVTINGMIPESLADADLHMQDFQENYVQTGPGQLFVGSTQHFRHDSLPASLRCNHSIQYDKARGPQPQLVQHLRASSISSTFDPEAEALRFQLTTALQAEENEVGCPEGFEMDTQGTFCVDRNECSAGPSPCSHTCRNAPGHFSCSCPTGFTLARDHRNCRDVDECVGDTHLCQEGQRCVNLLGTYNCLPDCRPGFRVTADGNSCEDVDECLEQLDECHYNQLCENTAGSHHCSCPRGYRQQGHGLPCLDINECLQLPTPCVYQCHNLQGSFHCLCPPGQTLLRDGRTCAPLERNNQNVTTVSLRNPFVPWLRSRIPRPRGSYHAWVSLQPGSGALSSMGRAWCPPGFIRQNGMCTDLDECRVRSLCQHACQNTEGSYYCLCPSGYRLLPSGKNCQDIDECEEDGIECGPGQMCFNTRGSYQCVDTPCPTAYRQGSSPGTCFRRCSQDCSASGPSTLQYRLLPLPLGVRAHHDVARLAAFSEAGVPANRTELTVLEHDPRSPFALRQLRAGQGAVYTRRALTRAGLYRMTVRAAAPRHQSIYVLLIAVSPYPY